MLTCDCAKTLNYVPSFNYAPSIKTGNAIEYENEISQPRVAETAAIKNPVIYDDTRNKTIIGKDSFCAMRYEY
jgi:hypothetical protein